MAHGARGGWDQEMRKLRDLKAEAVSVVTNYPSGSEAHKLGLARLMALTDEQERIARARRAGQPARVRPFAPLEDSVIVADSAHQAPLFRPDERAFAAAGEGAGHRQDDEDAFPEPIPFDDLRQKDGDE